MNLSILKSDKKNLNSFIAAGSALIFIGFIDIISNSFFSTNITAVMFVLKKEFEIISIKPINIRALPAAIKEFRFFLSDFSIDRFIIFPL